MWRIAGNWRISAQQECATGICSGNHTEYNWLFDVWGGNAERDACNGVGNLFGGMVCFYLCKT